MVLSWHEISDNLGHTKKIEAFWWWKCEHQCFSVHNIGENSVWYYFVCVILMHKKLLWSFLTNKILLFFSFFLVKNLLFFSYFVSFFFEIGCGSTVVGTFLSWSYLKDIGCVLFAIRQKMAKKQTLFAKKKHFSATPTVSGWF